MNAEGGRRRRKKRGRKRKTLAVYKLVKKKKNKIKKNVGQSGEKAMGGLGGGGESAGLFTGHA